MQSKKIWRLPDVLEQTGLSRPTIYEMIDRDVDPWRKIQEKHLVVLDDIGAREKMNEVHYQAVRRFADERETHHNRVAIYTSNIDPDGIADIYGDRIASRLLCGTVFRLDGPDRRFSR